jgi:5-methylcytosine-specific restriction enzyme subunit McrC
LELQYDEFTNDILPNRLVKAAAHRLGRIRLRSPEARRSLGWVAGILDGVSLVEFPPARVPTVAFDRLTEHYRDVMSLARLILGHGAFESGRGEVRASGFLMDMNIVFQEFLTQSLRDVLGASPETLRSDRELQYVTLDYEGRVSLRPDLTWWDGSDCLFVGDAKYKNVTGTRVPNADLYQMLSYATALGLPGGLLVYAQGEAEPTSYTVRRRGPRLEVAALNLAGALDDILEDVRDIAQKVVRLRDEAGQVGPGIVLNTLSVRPRVAAARTLGSILVGGRIVR